MRTSFFLIGFSIGLPGFILVLLDSWFPYRLFLLLPGTAILWLGLLLPEKQTVLRPYIDTGESGETYDKEQWSDSDIDSGEETLAEKRP